MTEHSSPPGPAGAARAASSESWLGRAFTVEVGPVAHGGHFVARHEGRVCFVRHALPGELVRVEVTEDGGGSFCRADAIEILRPSPERVEPPCPYAHPGGCGGCDFQHVAVPAQRVLKAEVIREQFLRLAQLPVLVTVEPLTAPDDSGLGWRRRVRYAPTSSLGFGLRAHRSHRVVAVDECRIAAAPIANPSRLAPTDPGAYPPGHRPAKDELEFSVDDDGQVSAVTLLATTSGGRVQRGPGQGRHRGSSRGRQRQPAPIPVRILGPQSQHYEVDGLDYRVEAGGFWQTHPGAAEAFCRAALDGAGDVEGAVVLDLYCGAGLFTAAFARAVGPAGRVVGLEADARAVADGQANLADRPQAEIRRRPVTAASIADLAAETGRPRVIVLDPPRSGAGREVMEALLAARPDRVVYVACDPAALARDVATAREAGWELDTLRAFDAFPMTHHVECVAILREA